MRSLLTAALVATFSALACTDAVDPLLADGDAAPLSGTGGGGGSGGGGSSGISNDEQCTGVVVGGTYENIKVPGGARCTLRRVSVRGNVVAVQNARLVVEDSRVEGNIQGENAALVHVRGGRLGGSLQIHEGASRGELGVSITGGTVLTQGNIQVTKMRTGRIVIRDAVLEKGNLQVEENAVTDQLDVRDNDVAQNLEVRKHRGSASKTVRGNTVRQKLECKENDRPLTGGPNRASEAEGQCF